MDVMGLVPAQAAAAQDHVCGGGPYRQIFAQIRDRELDCVPVNYGNVRVILEEGKQDSVGRGRVPVSRPSCEKTSATSSRARCGNPQGGCRGKGKRGWRRGRRGKKTAPGRRKASPVQWTGSDIEPLWPDHEGLGDEEGSAGVARENSAHGDVYQEGEGGGRVGWVDALCRMAGKVHEEQGEKEEMGWWESAEEDGHDRVIKKRRLSKWDLHVARAGKSLATCFRQSMPHMQLRRRSCHDVGTGGGDDISLDVLQKLREKIHDEKESKGPWRHKRKRNVAEKGSAEWDVADGVQGNFNEDYILVYSSNQDSEESQLHQAVQFNAQGTNDDQPMNSWDSGHAVENFQVNTKGMKRCSEGYKNGQGRLASFSMLGDIVDEKFRNQPKGALFQPQTVPTKRIEADGSHAQPLHGTVNPGGRTSRRPKEMRYEEGVLPQRRILTPVKKPPMISGRVIAGQRKEEQASFRFVSKPMALHPVHRNQFHSFVPHTDSVQERTSYPGGIYHRAHTFVPMQSRRSRMNSNGGGGRAACDEYQVYVRGDQRKNTNASASARVPSSTQRDVKNIQDFMDILRRGGLTMPSRAPSGVIPVIPQSQSFPFRAIDQHHVHPKYDNIVEHRMHRPPVTPRVALCRTVQPVSRSINGQTSESRVPHGAQRLFVKAPRQWSSGMKSVERESVMMPVEVVVDRAFAPLVDKSKV